jgi:hypothetical protein
MKINWIEGVTDFKSELTKDEKRVLADEEREEQGQFQGQSQLKIKIKQMLKVKFFPK